MGDFSDLLGFLVGRPFRPAEMRALDANDHAFVLKGHIRRWFDLHILEVLFDGTGAHAGADNVEEGQDAGPGTVDDSILKVLEIAPSGRARISHGGHTDA